MECDRATLTSILTGLGRLTEARAVAVWEYVECQLQLVADWQLDHELFDALRRGWRTCQAELCAGQHSLWRPDVLLVPLHVSGGPLLGVLQYVGTLPLPSEKQFLLDEAAEDLRADFATARPAARRPESWRSMLAVDIAGEVDEVKRRAYRTLVERCGGDVSHAAQTLDMARSAFYSRLNECGIFNLRRAPRDACDTEG